MYSTNPLRQCVCLTHLSLVAIWPLEILLMRGCPLTFCSWLFQDFICRRLPNACVKSAILFLNTLSTFWTLFDRETYKNLQQRHPGEGQERQHDVIVHCSNCKEKKGEKGKTMAFSCFEITVLNLLCTSRVMCSRLSWSVVLDCKMDMALSENGWHCKLYRMSDELRVTCITLMCSYPVLCTAGSEQNCAEVLRNTYSKYRLDLANSHLLLCSYKLCVENNWILSVLTSRYIYHILL